MKDLPSYREMIRSKFQERFERNSRYSLRAFAKDLGISAPMLSQILSRKRSLSLKMVKQFQQKLKLDPVEAQVFQSLIELESSPDERVKAQAMQRLDQIGAVKFHKLKADLFVRFADWIHFAILEATYLREFEPSTQWIAKRFGVPEPRVRMAVDRMVEFNWLQITPEGKWVSTYYHLHVEDGATQMAAVQNDFIIPLVTRNMEYLKKGNREHRVMSMYLFGFQKDRMAEARKRITEFERSFMAEFDLPTDSKDNIYAFSIQLAPTDEIKHEK